MALGLGLAAFMAALDLAIGRLHMRRTWQKLWLDFLPRSGNDLSLCLVFLILAPLWVARARGVLWCCRTSAFRDQWLCTGGWKSVKLL